MNEQVDVEALIDTFKRMTLLDLSEFVVAFEETFGVVAAAPAGPVVPPAGGSVDAAPVEEQDEFDVILDDVGGQKIQVIKEVRALTALGLKEAKDLVDSVPSPVLEKVDKATAEKAEAKLTAAGAGVSLR